MSVTVSSKGKLSVRFFKQGSKLSVEAKDKLSARFSSREAS